MGQLVQRSQKTFTDLLLARFESLQVLLRARLKIRDEAGRRSIWNLHLFVTLKVGGKHDLI